MMTPAERRAYDTAMQAIHAVHKWNLSIHAAVGCFEQGGRDTPVNNANICQYERTALALIDQAIEAHDALMVS